MADHVSDPVIRRLPAYYRHLWELDREGKVQISSQELGERMQLTPSQVRQDINSFGGIGRQGYGYPVKELKEHVRKVIGLDRTQPMIIVGAGRIGGAVVDYLAFAREVFPTLAMFDRDPASAPKTERPVPVYPVDDLEKLVLELKPKIAVLAVPAYEAQTMLDRLYALGIRAVWNFASLYLHYPPDMMVQSVHLADSLAILSYRIGQREAEEGRAE